MFATIRLFLAGLIFAQTIIVAWRAVQRHRRPRYAALPWDPRRSIRVGALDRAETAAARTRETHLTDWGLDRPGTVNSV